MLITETAKAICQDAALSFYLSEWDDGLTYHQVVDRLREVEDVNDDKRISVAYAYSFHTGDDLADEIESLVSLITRTIYAVDGSK